MRIDSRGNRMVTVADLEGANMTRLEEMEFRNFRFSLPMDEPEVCWICAKVPGTIYQCESCGVIGCGHYIRNVYVMEIQANQIGRVLVEKLICTSCSYECAIKLSWNWTRYLAMGVLIESIFRSRGKRLVVTINGEIVGTEIIKGEA